MGGEKTTQLKCCSFRTVLGRNHLREVRWLYKALYTEPVGSSPEHQVAATQIARDMHVRFVSADLLVSG